MSDFPQSICPSRPDSTAVLRLMLDQIMHVHANVSRFIHLGCDEVRFLSLLPLERLTKSACCMSQVSHVGKCSLCRERVAASRRAAADTMAAAGHNIFLQHVISMATYVSEKFDVQPLIWDDMLR
jgi:hexosaminidase